MLTDKDIGKRVICEGRRGRLETICGELIQVDMGLAGPWIGGSAGWTLDEAVAEPVRALELGAAEEGHDGRATDPVLRLRKLANVLTSTSSETMIKSAARLLAEIADDVEREQRKIIDLCGRADDAGVTAVQAVAQMKERLDAVEESAEAARAEWLDRDLGE